MNPNNHKHDVNKRIYSLENSQFGIKKTRNLFLMLPDKELTEMHPGEVHIW